MLIGTMQNEFSSITYFRKGETNERYISALGREGIVQLKINY